MYNFNGNYIEVSEIYALETFNEKDDKSHPYGLRVKLKNGSSYGVIYSTKSARDREATYISNAVDYFYQRQCPPSLEEIRYAISHETEKVRRDIRELKKLVLTMGDDK